MTIRYCLDVVIYKDYKKDKKWSFWKIISHNFDDCVKKSWENFSVNIPGKTNYLVCKDYPYQSIDSGLFYKKINNLNEFSIVNDVF